MSNQFKGADRQPNKGDDALFIRLSACFAAVIFVASVCLSPTFLRAHVHSAPHKRKRDAVLSEKATTRKREWKTMVAFKNGESITAGAWTQSQMFRLI